MAITRHNEGLYHIRVFDGSSTIKVCRKVQTFSNQFDVVGVNFEFLFSVKIENHKSIRADGEEPHGNIITYDVEVLFVLFVFFLFSFLFFFCFCFVFVLFLL